MPPHSARVARNVLVSDTLRERFGWASRAGRRGSLVRVSAATSTSAPLSFCRHALQARGHGPLSRPLRQGRQRITLPRAQARGEDGGGARSGDAPRPRPGGSRRRQRPGRTPREWGRQPSRIQTPQSMATTGAAGYESRIKLCRSEPLRRQLLDFRHWGRKTTSWATLPSWTTYHRQMPAPASGHRP